MPRRSEMEPIERLLRSYVGLKENADALTKQANRHKEELMQFVQDHGDRDPSGNTSFILNTPITTPGGKTFVGFTRQRRVSQSFDEEVAELVLLGKGIDRSEFVSTQEYIDQDKVARIYAEERISDEEFTSMISNNVTYAFVPTKG